MINKKAFGSEFRTLFFVYGKESLLRNFFGIDFPLCRKQCVDMKKEAQVSKLEPLFYDGVLFTG